MKSCPTCTTRVEADANFCPKCGHGFVNKGLTGNEVPPDDSVSQEKNLPAKGPKPRDPNENTRAIPQDGPPPPLPVPPPPAAPTSGHDRMDSDTHKMSEDNFLKRKTPVPEDEELTRVQPAPQENPTERYAPLSRSGRQREEGSEDLPTMSPHSYSEESHQDWNNNNQRKWLYLGVGATLVTLIGAIAMHLLVNQEDERKYPHKSPPGPTAEEKSAPELQEPLPKQVEPNSQVAKGPDEAPGPPIPEEASEPPKPTLNGLWVLDIEARLNSPEFGDMMEEEKNLLRSMMKKEGNKTAVEVSDETMRWTETGKTTSFDITNIEEKDNTWNLSLKQPDGTAKTLKGVIEGGGLNLQDPFGSGTRIFKRASP